MDEQTWKEIEAEVQRDLDAVETDQDVYAFLDKHFRSEEYKSLYRKLYRSDRHEMGRTPKQALINVISLSSEELP